MFYFSVPTGLLKYGIHGHIPMDAGIKAAKYDYIVTMDGDRQNDPADILIAAIQSFFAGLQLHTIVQQKRQDFELNLQNVRTMKKLINKE